MGKKRRLSKRQEAQVLWDKFLKFKPKTDQFLRFFFQHPQYRVHAWNSLKAQPDFLDTMANVLNQLASLEEGRYFRFVLPQLSRSKNPAHLVAILHLEFQADKPSETANADELHQYADLRSKYERQQRTIWNRFRHLKPSLEMWIELYKNPPKWMSRQAIEAELFKLEQHEAYMAIYEKNHSFEASKDVQSVAYKAVQRMLPLHRLRYDELRTIGIYYPTLNRDVNEAVPYLSDDTLLNNTYASFESDVWRIFESERWLSRKNQQLLSERMLRLRAIEARKKENRYRRLIAEMTEDKSQKRAAY